MVATHKELVLSAFDPTEAQAQGHSRTVDLLALLIVAAAVVTTVPAVGTILSVALLDDPRDDRSAGDPPGRYGDGHVGGDRRARREWSA